MPSKRRLTMRHIRQMLRLSAGGTSVREIAVVLGIARSTVQDNLDRAKAAGLIWPLPGELTDDALEHRLFARAGVRQGQRRREEPDWAALSIELRKSGVTLMILGRNTAASIQAVTATAASASCSVARATPVADDAPGACRRRQGLRGLFRKEGADRRSQDRRGPGGGTLRRHARRIELHLRRGHLDPDASGLDRLPCAHVRLLRWRAPADRARQSEVRRQPRQLP